MAGTRLFTWRFGAIALVNLLITLTFLLLMSFVASYAAARFGADGALAGFATGSFVLGALASRLALGQEVDRWGRRRVLLASLAIMLASAIASLWIGAFWLFAAVRILQGAAFGLASNITNIAAMELMPPARRGEGTGWFTLSVTLSTALGPFLGILLGRELGDAAVLWTAVACCAAALLVALPTRLPEAPAASSSQARGWRLRRVLEPAAMPLAGVALGSALGYASVLAFLRPFAQELGFAEWAPAFFLVYAGCLVLSRPLAGRILDRFGDNLVMAPSLACQAAALALLAVATAPWQLAIIAVLMALGHGTLMSAAQAIAVGRTAPDRRGVAVSTYYTGLDAGTGLGPLVFGVVGMLLGDRGMYASAACLALAMFALYWPLHGRRPLRPLSTVGGERRAARPGGTPLHGRDMMDPR